MQTSTTKKFLTLQEVADLTGYSVHSIRRYWPQWKEKHGVRVFKSAGAHNGNLLFDAESIIKMIESWEIRG